MKAHSPLIPLAFALIIVLLIGHQSASASAEGRIAVIADGNYRDTDDVCGTPVSMAILHSFDLADRLVHYSHSCDITPKGKDAGQGQEAARERNMKISCEGTADRWGAFPNVVKYFNCKREYQSAVEDLTRVINDSSAKDLLYIIEAGEPDVIYDAMLAAEETKRGFTRIVTHHPNNDRGDQHDLTDIVALPGFPSRGVLRIPNQNGELMKDLKTWHWARDHSDCRITWLWDRGEIAQVKKWGYRGIRGSFDCSDAGMIWYWATGEKEATMDQFKKALLKHVEENPIVACAEAEEGQISQGKVQASLDVSGQAYALGGPDFSVAWDFEGAAAEYELAFFLQSSPEESPLSVYIDGSKTGTISTNPSWTKSTLTTKIPAGRSRIELRRDNNAKGKLKIDMLMMTSPVGKGSLVKP